MRIEKEEIQEMESMLKHLYFTTNKTAPVRMNMRVFAKAYKVRNVASLAEALTDIGIIKRYGDLRKSAYTWESSNAPSKIMARRVIGRCAIVTKDRNYTYRFSNSVKVLTNSR